MFTTKLCITIKMVHILLVYITCVLLLMYIYSVIRRAWKRVENLQRQIHTSSNEAYSVNRMKYGEICEAENNPLVYSEVRRVESHDNSEYVSAEIQSNSNTNFIATVNEAYGIMRGPSEKTQNIE